MPHMVSINIIIFLLFFPPNFTFLDIKKGQRRWVIIFGGKKTISNCIVLQTGKKIRNNIISDAKILMHFVWSVIWILLCAELFPNQTKDGAYVCRILTYVPNFFAHHTKSPLTVLEYQSRLNFLFTSSMYNRKNFNKN